MLRDLFFSPFPTIHLCLFCSTSNLLTFYTMNHVYSVLLFSFCIFVFLFYFIFLFWFFCFSLYFLLSTFSSFLISPFSVTFLLVNEIRNQLLTVVIIMKEIDFFNSKSLILTERLFVCLISTVLTSFGSQKDNILKGER